MKIIKFLFVSYYITFFVLCKAKDHCILKIYNFFIKINLTELQKVMSFCYMIKNKKSSVIIF